MKPFRIAALAAALLLAAGAAYQFSSPADASVTRVCRPAASGASPGPGRWTAPGSGTAYNVDPLGCALISFTDYTDALAAGFRLGPLTQSVGLIGVTNNTVPSPAELVLPPGAFIQGIVVENTTANAVTGGVKIGTTSGGTEVVTALTCGASCLTHVADSAISKRVFSASTPTTLYITAVTSMNSAVLNVTVTYAYF